MEGREKCHLGLAVLTQDRGQETLWTRLVKSGVVRDGKDLRMS